MMTFSKNTLLTILLLSMKEDVVDAFAAPFTSSMRVSFHFSKNNTQKRKILWTDDSHHITSQIWIRRIPFTHLGVETTRFLYEKSGRTDITWKNVLGLGCLMDDVSRIVQWFDMRWIQVSLLDWFQITMVSNTRFVKWNITMISRLWIVLSQSKKLLCLSWKRSVLSSTWVISSF
jgi:hypothetical protein